MRTGLQVQEVMCRAHIGPAVGVDCDVHAFKQQVVVHWIAGKVEWPNDLAIQGSADMIADRAVAAHVKGQVATAHAYADNLIA